jgi:hypothetical protein
MRFIVADSKGSEAQHAVQGRFFGLKIGNEPRIGRGLSPVAVQQNG